MNKLRLRSELETPGEMQRLHGDPPFWDSKAPGFTAWLDARKEAGEAGDEGREPAVLRLRWILECTMGAPGAFEHRRQELTVLAREAGSEEGVSDAAVLKSFLDSVRNTDPFPWP